MTKFRPALRVLLIAAVAILSGALTFGQPSRPLGEQRGQGLHRDNERVTAQGKITSVRHERDGYRIQLDRGNDSYWVPERSLRGHSNELRVGISIRLGGVFRGGFVTVDVIDWPPLYPAPDNRRLQSDVVRGVIQQVDFRHDEIVIREARTERLITVNVMRNDGTWNRSFDLRRVHRGDFITLSGDWRRNGEFDAYRVESVNRPRY
jgi:hypothetical protein